MIFSLLSVLFFTSCEEDETILDSEFRIEFSDGTQITANNILYCDSSTHLLFLKGNLELSQSVSDFNLVVNNDTVFNGIIHSCVLSSPPPLPHYISDCFLYGNNILEIGFYGDSNDLRNDPRIINALKNRNLLRNGIGCTIDNIGINPQDNSSQVICTITLKNNDDVDYYIPDPGKMGDLHFSYFTGGLTIKNTNTKISYPLRWSVPYPEWNNISIDDLSVLKKNSTVTFTFQSSDYHKMDPGNYSARFRFCGITHHTADFNLNQENGRIWVGAIISTFNNIIVE